MSYIEERRLSDRKSRRNSCNSKEPQIKTQISEERVHESKVLVETKMHYQLLVCIQSQLDLVQLKVLLRLCRGECILSDGLGFEHIENHRSATFVLSEFLSSIVVSSCQAILYRIHIPMDCLPIRLLLKK